MSAKDLRSFMGLAQQLASFVPDLAHMTSTLRPLLKKDIQWLWLDDHENSFKEVKELLTSKTVIHPFDEEADTFLLTDASRLYTAWDLHSCREKTISISSYSAAPVR